VCPTAVGGVTAAGQQPLYVEVAMYHIGWGCGAICVGAIGMCEGQSELQRIRFRQSQMGGTAVQAFMYTVHLCIKVLAVRMP
jgi:hypothetical protein